MLQIKVEKKIMAASFLFANYKQISNCAKLDSTCNIIRTGHRERGVSPSWTVWLNGYQGTGSGFRSTRYYGIIIVS